MQPSSPSLPVRSDHHPASVLLLILAVVRVMDGLSAWLRKRFLVPA
jgi:ABC-type phosphate/phosphonate transport system permease subunit